MLTYTEVSYFDDLLVDCLVDKVYFWGETRKTREYKPIRGVSGDMVMDILHRKIVNTSPRDAKASVASASEEFQSIKSVTTFLGRFQRPQDRVEFDRHVRRYFSIYLPDCGFGIEVTNRYRSRSHSNEACVIARRAFLPGEEIRYLAGVLVELTEEEEEKLNEGRDFSIINSSRLGANCLMLGPARFVNHDCDANARFVPSGKQMYIHAKRPIRLGEEITVEYSKNYFGKRNRECLCATCERLQVNGHSRFPIGESDTSDDEDSDSDVKRAASLPSPPLSARSSQSPTVSSSLSLSSRQSSPPTSIEPEQNTPESESSSQTSSQAGSRSLRPRKMSAPTPLLNISEPALANAFPVLTQLDHKAMESRMKVYYSEPYEDCSPHMMTKNCFNCGVPFVRPIERNHRLDHRLAACPRCFRHAKLYSCPWPGVKSDKPVKLYYDTDEEEQKEEVDSEEDNIEAPKLTRTQTKAIPRRSSNKRSFAPAVSDDKPAPKRPRSLSSWLLKRRMEDPLPSDYKPSSKRSQLANRRRSLPAEQPSRISKRLSERQREAEMPDLLLGPRIRKPTWKLREASEMH
uniref:Histone-lysine N-methyltransferase SET9 n=1 Tax=Blastobotrys adeninivorans TaxID=409370 RepID=A0A060TD63_BLAAD